MNIVPQSVVANAIEGWGGVLLGSPAEGWVVVRWSVHGGGEVVAIYGGSSEAVAVCSGGGGVVTTIN